MASFLLFIATSNVILSVVTGTCVRTYFAQPVIYDKAMDIDFYYTGEAYGTTNGVDLTILKQSNPRRINIPSVARCAEFCGLRQFCRTAVYNFFSQTCAISYEYTLNCRYRKERYIDFDAKKSSSNLIQVACISKCEEEKTHRFIARKQPHLIVYGPTETTQLPPKTLRKVDIITGEPNNGILPTLVPITRASNDLSTIPNTSDRLQTMPSKIPEEGFLNRIIIGNITAEHNALPLQDTHISSLMKNGDTQVCYRTIEHRYLLGSSFERHAGKSINDCRCLCAATHASNYSQRCLSFHWYSHGTCVLNKGSHRGKFDLIEDYLATYQYVSCEVKVLLEVASKICIQHEDTKAVLPSSIKNKKSQTQSIQEVSSTLVSPINTTGNVETHANTIEITTTRTTEIPQNISKIEENLSENNTQSHESVPNAITTNENLEGIGAKSTEIEKLSSHTGEIQINAKNQTTISPESSTQRIIEVTNNEVSKEFAPTTLNNQSRIDVTSTETTTEYTTIPLQSLESTTDPPMILSEEAFVTENPSATNDGNSSKQKIHSSELSDCFEEVPGYIMVNVAGGLEHDVSKEECKCYCANSKESGRYSFECASATYYHEERDCILNLENRLMRPHLFEAFTASNVTYIGHKCERVKSIESISNGSLPDGCRRTTPAPSTTTQISRKRNTGVNSDACFVELSEFVLEGTALAVESGKTPQECKCLCADGEKVYGEACQSFQYYYDSQTCLLNKQNRFSNPENFNFVPSSQPRSYFEYKCATKDLMKTSYTNEKCSIDVSGHSHENKSEEGRNSTQKKQKEMLAQGEESTKFKTGISEVNESKKKEKTGKEKNKEFVHKLLKSEREVNSLSESDEKAENSENEMSSKELSTEEFTATTSSTPLQPKKLEKKVSINRDIPEAEGLDEEEFEDDIEEELSAELVSTTAVHNSHSTPFADPIISTTKPTNKHKKLQGVKTKKFDAKEAKILAPEETSTLSSTVAHSTSTTTTMPTQKTTTEWATPTYPPAGRCTYSALYQTAFAGRRLLKTVHVKSPSDCFAACFALRCRSANLIAQGELNSCELFHDSLIDYRRPDMIGYDGSTVYFDGIHCSGG